MKRKIIDISIRLFLLALIVYLLMYADDSDIQYIYANF